MKASPSRHAFSSEPTNEIPMQNSNKVGWVALVISVLIAIAQLTGNGLSFGSISSPPSNFDYVQISQAIGWLTSGIATPINETAVRAALTAASTTPCAIQNPFSATSTVVLAEINVTTATSSLGQLVFATSTTAFGTTTGSFSKYTIAANAQQTVAFNGVATSTGNGPIVGPGNWVVIGMDTGSTANYGYTYGGTCAAKFISVN